MKSRWLGVVALTAGVAFACSSGKPRPPLDEDAGAGGRAAAGGSGSGGGAAGGTAGGTGGTDGGTATPADTTPPQFGGITGVTDAGNGRVTVTWAAGTDNATPAASLVYVIYRASAPGKEDFTGARRCGAPLPDAGAIEQADAACSVVAPAGATSGVVGDVIPGRGFYYVVRAVDDAGNRDSNTKEIGFTADDTTSPDFGGVRSVTALSPFSIGVTWGAGYDLGTPDSLLKFAVYVTANGTPDPASGSPVLTTAPGVHSATVAGLLPLTTYSVLVRAIDGGGNQDKNDRILKAATPEGIPPAFGGVKRGDAEGTTVRLFWTPATDNVTEQPNIVYDVYQALNSHAQNFATPTFSSDPGVSSIALTGQQPGTAYFYVVRARDAVGNRDSNIVQVQVNTPLIDNTPPLFTGITSVTSDSPGTLVVTWPPAQDDTSTQKQISYALYLATSSQLPLSPTATPTVTVLGTTTARIPGFAPDTTRFVVVRAIDAAGNLQTANDKEASGHTLAAVTSADGGLDTTAPVLSANPTVTQVINPASKLNVSWPAATDDTDSASDIRYHICASATPADCQGANFVDHVIVTTNWGTTTAALTLLTPRTEYSVYVRAEDRSGNLEVADHFATQSTATSWSINVEPILFDRCIACHDTFDKPAAIVGIGSAFVEAQACVGQGTSNVADSGACLVLLIDPGRPEFSYIYRKINPLNLQTSPFSSTVPNNYDGLQMPRDSSGVIDADDDDAVRSWIEQGANAN